MKLAVFDLDGTLADTNAIDTVCYVQALRDEFDVDAAGLNWEDYTFVTDSGITEQLFQERFGRDITSQEVDRLRARLVARLEEAAANDPDHFLQVAGASEILLYLNGHPEWCVALATGCWQASAKMKARAAALDIGGFLRHFPRTVGRERKLSGLRLIELENSMRSSALIA